MSACIPGRRTPPEPWLQRSDDLAAQPSMFEALAPDRDSGRAQALLRTVETEIIPRLMMLHRQGEVASALAGLVPDAREPEADFSAEEVEQFTDRLLTSQDAALAGLREHTARGVPAAALCLNLMAPSARRLGELWSDDLCDFTQVTIALGRMQALLHVVTGRLPTLAASSASPRFALFAPAPGEQHTLGLSMVRDFFRAAGWDVWGDTPDAPAALLPLVRERHFDVVGFSIGSERHVDDLSALIVDIRRVSSNPRLLVLAGGPLMLAQPDLLTRLGADATGEDARQAILVAHDRVGQRD